MGSQNVFVDFVCYVHEEFTKFENLSENRFRPEKFCRETSWCNTAVPHQYIVSSSALVVGIQGEMMTMLAAWIFFKSAYFLQRNFLVQHGAVDIIKQPIMPTVDRLFNRG